MTAIAYIHYEGMAVYTLLENFFLAGKTFLLCSGKIRESGAVCCGESLN
jgi:hypothetical protein